MENNSKSDNQRGKSSYISEKLNLIIFNPTSEYDSALKEIKSQI